MADYNLKRYANTTVVPESGTASIAGITLPGKNYLGYGNIVDQALLNMVENFANTNPPTDAIIGQLWFDTTASVMRINVGTQSSPNWANVAIAGGNLAANIISANSLNAGNIIANNGTFGNLVGTNITATLANIATANIGNLITGNANITGGNIRGNIGGTLFYKTTFNSAGSGSGSGSVYDASSNVTVSWNTVGAASGDTTGWANVGLGPVSNTNVKITGGTAGQVLSTDGTGILSWITPATGSISNGTSNVSVITSGDVGISASGVANVLVVTSTGANITGTANITGNANVGNIGGTGGIFTYITGDGGNLSNITGANVSGEVAFAATANAVAGANVSGEVAFAATANAVAGANVSGQVANALVAGTVYTAAQPNITSVGTLTSLVVTGNVAGGNITTGGNVVAAGDIQADTGFIGNTVTTRTGPLTLTATGTSNITLAVGTGNINLSTMTNITNVKDPVNAQDAATKIYVDALVQGLQPKAAVECATGTNITLAPAPSVIDGYTLLNNDRVLVKAQTTAADNGIYTFDGTNLVRSTDSDSASELADGTFVFVTGGSTFAASGFVQTSAVVTLGTDPVVFTQFSSGGSYSAGSGLSLTGSQFSVATTGITAGSHGNATHIPSFTVTATGQLTAASNIAVSVDAVNLTGTTLSSTVVNSSLTSVGVLTSLQVSGSLQSRIDPRVFSSASVASITPDVSLYEQFCLTAQAAALTINAPTGTPVEGNKIIFRIIDNGTTRAITWNAAYVPIGVTLPIATTVNKMSYIGCIYNATNSRWDVVAVTTQA